MAHWHMTTVTHLTNKKVNLKLGIEEEWTYRWILSLGEYERNSAKSEILEYIFQNVLSD